MSLSFSQKTKARNFAVQFLYQSEAEEVYYFSEGIFDQFAKHFEIPSEIQLLTAELVRGVLDHTSELDKIISNASKRWKIERMASTDRAILRLATHELLESDTPVRVILNEAIKLAKRYGTENSGQFINGVLDAIAKNKGGHPK